MRTPSVKNITHKFFFPAQPLGEINTKKYNILLFMT